MKKKPVTWNGVEYASITEASKQLGVHINTMRNRLKKGYTSDTDIQLPGEGARIAHSKPVTWNGINYSSITSASESVGVALSTMIRWLEHGYTSDDDIENNRLVSCVWNGISYDSISSAARDLNITPEAMRQRLAKGYSSDSDLN